MAGPLLGSGPFVHTDLGKAGPADPFGYFLTTGLATGETIRHRAFQTLWSYTVPAGKKATVEYLNIHYSLMTISGTTNNNPTRSGNVFREAVTSLVVDGTTILVMEGRGAGAWEGAGATVSGVTAAPGRDADNLTKLHFGDGIQFTNGQVFTATAVIENLAQAIDGIHPQVHRIRLHGKNTASGAPMFIEAVIRPSLYGTVTYYWNGVETATSYTVDANGFTLLSVSFRTDIGLEWIASSHNNLYLNDQILIEMGPFMQGTGLNVETTNIPLYGIDLYEGDVLALRGAPGVDCGQVISVALIGVETSLATYSRNRVWSP
jgi:hypothetical protein